MQVSIQDSHKTLITLHVWQYRVPDRMDKRKSAVYEQQNVNKEANKARPCALP